MLTASNATADVLATSTLRICIHSTADVLAASTLRIALCIHSTADVLAAFASTLRIALCIHACSALVGPAWFIGWLALFNLMYLTLGGEVWILKRPSLVKLVVYGPVNNQTRPDNQLLSNRLHLLSRTLLETGDALVFVAASSLLGGGERARLFFSSSDGCPAVDG